VIISHSVLHEIWLINGLTEHDSPYLWYKYITSNVQYATFQCTP